MSDTFQSGNAKAGEVSSERTNAPATTEVRPFDRLNAPIGALFFDCKNNEGTFHQTTPRPIRRMPSKLFKILSFLAAL
ncbi:MAG: hypothetical protein MK180_15045 [Rhodobacteraceae bacterium]|nr:hypothetical protein [Paracoccaceae bacterium]